MIRNIGYSEEKCDKEYYNHSISLIKIYKVLLL